VHVAGMAMLRDAFHTFRLRQQQEKQKGGTDEMEREEEEDASGGEAAAHESEAKLREGSKIFSQVSTPSTPIPL
jgi:hypothetical protein